MFPLSCEQEHEAKAFFKQIQVFHYVDGGMKPKL